MDRDVIVFESPQWQLNEVASAALASKGNLQKKICSLGGVEISNFLQLHQAQSIHGIFIPASIALDANLQIAMNAHPLRNQIILVVESNSNIDFEALCTYTHVRAEDLEDAGLLEHLLTATSTKRRTGIKAFLETGTTIYSENIFRPTGLGLKLDPCFQLAASHLGETRALHAWSVLNLFIFHSLASLNENFSENSNKRVKIQIAADKNKLCLGVSYPVTEVTARDLFYGLQDIYQNYKENSWLAAIGEAGYIEVTNYHVSKRGEIIVFFEKKISAKYLPFVVRNITTNELEDAEDAKSYNYKLFGTIKEAIEKGDTRVVTGAKEVIPLSKRMSAIAAKHSGNTVIKGTTQHIEGQTTVIKGQAAAAPESKTVISGVTEHIDNVSALKIKSATPAAQATPPSAVSSEPEDGDENDILAAIAEVTEGLEEDEVVEATPPAAATPSATPATDKNPEVAYLASAQEQDKLKKLFSLEAAKNEKDNAKLFAIFEDRLKSAKDIIDQREGLVKKLNKQIEEIMDPLKSGVISGLNDTQKDALKQNVQRLEAELEVAAKREKDLMTATDKAIQARDEASKKLKALEAKQQSSEQALSSRLAQMEKVLEAEKAAKAELIKRLNSPAKKAA